MADEIQTVEQPVDAKHILESKTLWVNLIAIIAFFVQRKYGFVIDESIQAQILGIINVGLRTITKDPVRWNIKPKEA